MFLPLPAWRAPVMCLSLWLQLPLATVSLRGPNPEQQLCPGGWQGPLPFPPILRVAVTSCAC